MEFALTKIVVFQTWGIGDMVLTTPMLQALRTAQPAAHITVVAGSNAAADVIRGSKLCDEVRIMSFRRSSVAAIIHFFVKLRTERFDMALLASRLSPRIAFFLRFVTGIGVVVGDGSAKKGRGYTHWRRVDVSNHKVTENTAILRLLVPHADHKCLYFHIDDAARAEANRLWNSWKLDGFTVLGIHPGGGGSECLDKRLPVQLCREVVMQFLAGADHRKVVMYFGPDEEHQLSSYDWGIERVVLFSGLDIRIVGAMIAKTKVLLSGDTGLGHIAAAVGTPVVTVAGPTDINHTKPWGKGHEVLRTGKYLDCMPCYETALYGNCPYGQECMRSVEGRKVWETLVNMLG